MPLSLKSKFSLGSGATELMYAVACVESHVTNILYFKHEKQRSGFLQFGGKMKLKLFKKIQIIHKRILDTETKLDFASLFDKNMQIQGC